jgi:hypothetical protein
MKPRTPAYEQRKLALIEEITAAFDGVAREDGVTLSETYVIDDYGSPEERAEARKEDTETRWQDVPDESIVYADAALSFLDPKGFRYYIPAYLIWYLRKMDGKERNSSETFESVIYGLTIQNDSAIDDYSFPRFRLLNSQQSRAIAHFLQFEAEHEGIHRDARRALERYWGQFLQEEETSDGKN